MYPDLFKQLGLKAGDLYKYDTPLVGFDGRMVIPNRQSSLPVNTEGKEVMVNFIVVSSFSLYMTILGKPWIHAMGAIPSTLHVKVKLHIDHGVTVELQEPLEGKGTDSVDDLIKVSILPYENKNFYIGNSMKQEDRTSVLLLLVQNLDIFAWSPYDVPSVDPKFITHKLNVDPTLPPKKQKSRRSAKQHVEAVKQEVKKLKLAATIKEVYFPVWLFNTVVVKKKNNKWRVYVDFTDLNLACPKDPFPMPKIDQLVDATCGHPNMSFLDAFQGYH
ncbi:uncharacterized protein LOC142625402 [Castanea sativa]|uniref:uncharacterized protein LOC142625402 n=1 Tax=Castanea sativa TaxID=21020 RepID=UPI003F64C5EE